MAVRPKTRPSNGILGEPPGDEISCGYVMHQLKTLKCKMRWGQLWTGVNEDGRRRCTIRLFKFDIANPKPGTFTKKDLKLKLCFEFNESEFCGLEKGEHYGRNGMRRYICVILRDRHLIVQDAITALTDTDHNVIGTWYRKVSDTMHYINRWRVCGIDQIDVRFIHLTRENMCVCYSLHNSHAGQKGKTLLENIYKTTDITNTYETQETFNGEVCTRLTFYDRSRGLDVKNVFLVHGLVKLARALASVNQRGNTPLQGSKVTLCPRFDDLNINTNLVKVTPVKNKGQTPPLDLKQLSGAERVNAVNPYVMYESEVTTPPDPWQLTTNLEPDNRPLLRMEDGFGYQLPEKSGGAQWSRRDTNGGDVTKHGDDLGWCGGANEWKMGVPRCEAGDVGRKKFSPTNPFAATNGVAPRPHSLPHTTPPRDPTDDEGLGKKAPELTTQTSVDSAYQTGTYMSMTNTTNEPRQNMSNSNTGSPEIQPEMDPLENFGSHYINVQNASPAHAAAEQITEFHESTNPPPAVVQPGSPDLNDAPEVPPRETEGEMTRSSSRDPLRAAIDTDTLPPVIAEGDPARPGYENSMDGCDIEVTIGEILKGTHHEVRGRNLGLPYSVYMALILGLEKDSVADGNWRGLASALGLKLRDVEQIESVIHNHSNLLPAEIVLLHWQRTEAPYAFTRASLKNILSEVMKRMDLAVLIPPDEEKEESECDNDETKEDETEEKSL